MEQIENIDNLKSIPKIGRKYLVPCIVEKIEPTEREYDEQMIWMDLEEINQKYRFKYVTPIINHLHNDIENGQEYEHYHVDYRFMSPFLKRAYNSRINKYKFNNIKIEYFELECLTNLQAEGTPIDMINKSKLKHNCIWKGKCPHRGYDLSQVLPIHERIKANTSSGSKGVRTVTCPLHGLKFDYNTKEILKIN